MLETLKRDFATVATPNRRRVGKSRVSFTWSPPASEAAQHRADRWTCRVTQRWAIETGSPTGSAVRKPS